MIDLKANNYEALRKLVYNTVGSESENFADTVLIPMFIDSIEERGDAGCIAEMAMYGSINCCIYVSNYECAKEYAKYFLDIDMAMDNIAEELGCDMHKPEGEIYACWALHVIIDECASNIARALEED